MNATRRPDTSSVEDRTLYQELFSLSRLVLLVALVAAIGWSVQWLYRKYDVPVAVIGVDGELINVDAGDVEKIVATHLGGGFLSLDLAGICEALEQHPWVATASARRKWPDEVVIAIEEESAIARWGEGRFLSNKGQILEVGNASLPQHLPQLYGPAGLERRVMQQYRNFSQVLQPTGMKVKTFGMAARGNWQVTFEPELELVVGKEPVAKKLERFLLVWEKALQERKDAIERIDLRYGNGLAVRWKQDKDSALEADITG